MARRARPTVCFFHVQKCGGTSIRAAIRCAFRPRRPEEVVIEMDGAASTRQAAHFGMSNFAFRDQLLAYHLDSKYTRAVMGHFRYTASAHERFLDRAKFVTVLRDPADRLLSSYFYDRYKVEEHGKVDDSLRDFLVDAYGEPTLRGRSHAEWYVGMFRGDGVNRPCRARQVDVDRAIANLRRFHLVGFLDDLAPFVARLEEWSDAPLDVPDLNRSPAEAKHRREVTPDLQEVVDEICRPARAVYDAIREHALG
jgi:Sulfotransferase family